MQIPVLDVSNFFQQFLKFLSLINKSSCFIVCILLLLLLILAKRYGQCQLTTAAGVGSGEGAPPQYEIIKKLLNYGYTQNL